MELNAQVERAEDRSRELTTKLTATERQLDQARAQYGDAVDSLDARLVDIYKSEAPDYVDVLLSSDGFDDLSTRSAVPPGPARRRPEGRRPGRVAPRPGRRALPPRSRT